MRNKFLNNIQIFVAFTLFLYQCLNFISQKGLRMYLSILYMEDEWLLGDVCLKSETLREGDRRLFSSYEPQSHVFCMNDFTRVTGQIYVAFSGKPAEINSNETFLVDLVRPPFHELIAALDKMQFSRSNRNSCSICRSKRAKTMRVRSL